MSEEEEEEEPPGLIDDDDSDGEFSSQPSRPFPPGVASASASAHSLSSPGFSFLSHPANSSSPTDQPVHRIRACYLGGEGKKGRKYFITGLVNKKLFHQALDSAADISIIPEHSVTSLGLSKYQLDHPFTCEGFQSSSSSSVVIDHFCCVDVNLGGAVLPVKFYVAPIAGKFALLGTDVLGDPSAGLSFETSSGIVKFGGKIFYSKKSTEASIVEFRRREKMGDKSYRRQNSMVDAVPKMRSSRRVVVGPRSVTWIDASISGGPVSKMHSFHSFYSEDEDLISIPNFLFHRRRHRYRLPVTNETSSSFTFPAGAVLGDVVQHLKDSAKDEAAPSIFHIVAGKELTASSLVGEEEEEEEEEEE